MSGIAGVWNLDGAPVDRCVVEGMAAALRHRGPDGEALRTSGPVGLVHQHFRVTAEERHEHQPLLDEHGAMIVWDGRLDNRAELISRFGLSRSASDAACALAAYRCWGPEFPSHLNGDFAVAVWDPTRHRLLLARDPIGVRPLYYFSRHRVFAFASEIKALLAHPEAPRGVDDEGLADFLLIGARPVDRHEITCFAGISALVPSHLALVSPEGCSTRRYWDFDPGRSIRLGSFEQYVEGFRDVFAQAVSRRARSAHPVAVSVSGGLDSSSIFCQALVLQGAGRADFPSLAGISYVGAAGSDADERRYLVDIEKEYAVEIERFPLEGFSGVLEGVEEQIGAVEAPLLDYQWRVTREAARRVSSRSARVFLSGHWGDQVLFSPAYLVDLLAGLSWREVRRHLREYQRWFGSEEVGILTRRLPADLLRHFAPRPVRRPLKWLRRRLFPQRPRQWFSDSFLKLALRFADRPAEMGEGFHSAQARSIYLEARSRYHVQCMEWNNKIAALQGQEAAFPFLDRDLLAYLMAIPGEIQNRNGVPRALLREAMRGILPEPVRRRTWKADFTDAVNLGVRQDLRQIREALTPDCLAVALGYVDARRLAPALDDLTRGLSGDDCVNSWDLVDLFSLETWLRIFSGLPDPARRFGPARIEEGVA